MAEAAFTALIGAVASSVVGGLLTKKPDSPAAPEVKPPVAMPVPEVNAAKRRRKAATSMFGERQALSSESTLLTGNDTLGA